MVCASPRVFRNLPQLQQHAFALRELCPRTTGEHRHASTRTPTHRTGSADRSGVGRVRRPPVQIRCFVRVHLSYERCGRGDSTGGNARPIPRCRPGRAPLPATKAMHSPEPSRNVSAVSNSNAACTRYDVSFCSRAIRAASRKVAIASRWASRSSALPLVSSRGNRCGSLDPVHCKSIGSTSSSPRCAWAMASS